MSERAHTNRTSYGEPGEVLAALQHNPTHSMSPQRRSVQPGMVSPRGKDTALQPKAEAAACFYLLKQGEVITATYSEAIECGQAGSAVLGTLIICLSSTNTNNSNA